MIGIASAFLISVFDQGIPGQLFYENAIWSLTLTDVLGCIIKATCFGLLVGLIATYSGFQTRRATEAVGVSATNAMVQGVLGVLLVDLVLTKTLLHVAGE